MERKVALITGASSGIGKATAQLFAKNNYDLILTARRKERLVELKKELKLCGVSIYISAFDIRDIKETKEAFDAIPVELKKRLSILINNAGLAAGKEDFNTALLTDWEQMIDTNIKGLLYITKLVTPLFIEKQDGHIINMASTAGKEVYENGNVYCATKHAVDALSKAMRMDLFRHNIQVTNVAPGAVETEFSLVRFKGNQSKADSTYDGYLPLTGEDVAEAILFAANRPSHVSINDIVITPKAQGSATLFHKK
jgi:3-hydroxy acid dehydrogenase / malonic semialdehyde reductase